ncbi:SLC13 family permease [Rhodovulum steppense]|uniref:Sodium-dependent dicarboxylate transporter 2/3/5 n=1 Tax=Rhodovulum steppense TaxID=540251 RepID=A0A4R1YM83_9RHOB|nr:DASS family sodium-coupled anion symporter [Rhodovulum steppense]TCM78377.1 sodium-dependent dicarboxylate transporter 2/3/5 [Rhodovulum steppense]
MRSLPLLIGPIGPCAAALLPPPGGLTAEAWNTAGIAFMMAVWWMTGALPLAVTAVAPLVLAPAFDLGPFDAVARSYVHPLLFLFLGGFLIGRAIERWGLHRRIALWILGIAGDAPTRLIGGVMLATAFLSLWISNTAAAMVMLPIAASLTLARPKGDRFSTALMLGVAYAATIGGMGSLIGTPPNALFAAYVSQTYGREIGFAQWAAVGLPVAGLLLGAAWLVLVRLSPGVGNVRAADAGVERPGAWTAAERRVAVVAGLTATAWIARPFAGRLLPWLEVNDAMIAMAGGAALFLLPSGANGRLLDFSAIKGLRWDILVLFGGGLALAGLIDRSGLAGWIGSHMVLAGGLPLWLLILAMAAAIVYVGELASNTAMAAVFLPVAGAAALAVGAEPVSFLLPIALAASVGFMLPVATPPNAIVMENPAVTRQAMLRAGALLDVIGLLLAVGLCRLLAAVVF